MTSPWPAPFADAPIRGTVAVPGSKSETNRALILAALADGPSTIAGALRSRDTDLMIGALTALGVDVIPGPDPTQLRITPGPLHGASVDAGLAGTVMRFVPPVATLADGPVHFDGDDRARARPQAALLDGLRTLGARIDGDGLPFTVHGTGALRGGPVEVDASGSSQFVSGLLLSGARFDRGVTVTNVGASLPSMPHIDMTVAMLARAGVRAETDTAADFTSWHVAPQGIRATEWAVEPDLSNATPFLAAAAVTGGAVTVPGWPAATTQAGDLIREILMAMGASVERTDAGLTVRGTGGLSGIDLDLGDAGELAPTIAALAALAEGPSTLRGIAHLRGHETDRLAALATELTALGAHVTETDDGLVIEPIPAGAEATGVWHAYADHRMATAGAILGLRVPGVRVDDIGTTAKTLPDFPGLWADLVTGARP